MLRLLFSLLVISLVACTNQSNSAETPNNSSESTSSTSDSQGGSNKPQEPEIVPLPIEGEVWEVLAVNINGQGLAPENGVEVEMRFKKGRMNGNGGCNRINARYEGDPEGTDIKFSNIGSSKKVCKAEMRVEQRLIGVLKTVTKYSMKGKPYWFSKIQQEILLA